MMSDEFPIAQRRCPECESYLRIDARKCKCGWKIAKEKETDFRCCYRNSSVICSAEGKWRMNPKEDNPKFLCWQHYEAVRPKSKIDLEIERRAKLFEQAAKESGLNGDEYFQDAFGTINKNYLKQTVNALTK